MEQLFVENFFNKYRTQTSKDLNGHFHDQRVNDEQLPSTFDQSILKTADQKFDRKNSDLLLDMSICLDRLEKEVEEGYPDFTDYQCIFNKIRASFKQKSVEGVIKILDDLEDLLDLGISSLIIKKNIKGDL